MIGSIQKGNLIMLFLNRITSDLSYALNILTNCRCKKSIFVFQKPRLQIFNIVVFNLMSLTRLIFCDKSTTTNPKEAEPRLEFVDVLTMSLKNIETFIIARYLGQSQNIRSLWCFCVLWISRASAWVMGSLESTDREVFRKTLVDFTVFE